MNGCTIYFAFVVFSNCCVGHMTSCVKTRGGELESTHGMRLASCKCVSKDTGFIQENDKI